MDKSAKLRGLGIFEACCSPDLRPRDRIVLTARELFHRHGIRAIGVDAIAEAAGTNKMTLYRHFSSKDELVVECLSKIAREAEDDWMKIEAEFPADPVRRLHEWMRAAAECISGDSRGCDFANAAVELTECDHPARRVIEEFKARMRKRLAALCCDAGATQPELLADALCLLFEGARVSRQSVGAEGPCAKFVRMSEVIIASFGVGQCEIAEKIVDAV